MRSLIIRFIDSEGPGLLGELLKEKGYQVTYHNAYQKGLHLIPQAHQFFDLIVLMGGPMSVADPSLKKFFKPYMDLVRGCFSLSSAKCIGICLGSQIIAEALGGHVREGEKGREVGFGELKIQKPDHPIFRNLAQPEKIIGFHLHGDTFALPEGANLLASSDQYENQIFSVQDRIYGFQVHLEPSWTMLQVWSNVHKDYMKEAGYTLNESDRALHSRMMVDAKSVFSNII